VAVGGGMKRPFGLLGMPSTAQALGSAATYKTLDQKVADMLKKGA